MKLSFSFISHSLVKIYENKFTYLFEAVTKALPTTLGRKLSLTNHCGLENYMTII